VEVCAPILERGAPTRDVRRYRGPAVAAGERIATSARELRATGTWGLLAASDVPVVDLGPGERLATIASATAGFRDEFYGLAALVEEAPTGTAATGKLVTVGMIDPLHCRWGTGEHRFAKRRWTRPRVDPDAVESDRLRRWVQARTVPKVLVATQTRVVEAVVDERGDWLPVTPVISVEPDPEHLWHIAAMLSSPPVAAWAGRAYAGAARSADAIKLSARQLLDIPIPVDRVLWDSGANRAREVSDAAARGDHDAWNTGLQTLGATMTRAYGADESVLAWWLGRLPGWR